MKYYKQVTCFVESDDLVEAGLTFNELYCDLRDIFGCDNVVEGPNGEIRIELVEDDWHKCNHREADND